MPITPDTKDWTWVLERACPECGFDARSIARDRVGRLAAENAAAWRRVLDRRDALAERPSDDVWAPIEYACHVRDVFRLYDERLRLMLEEDDPSYPNWDQDAAATTDRYLGQARASSRSSSRWRPNGWPAGSTACGATSGRGPAPEATGPGSPWSRSPAT